MNNIYSSLKILNTNDLVVLSCVRDKENNTGLCSARGTTKAVLVEKSELSLSTINRSVKKLVECGLLENGVKQVNRTTYFITSKGLEILKEAMASSGALKRY